MPPHSTATTTSPSPATGSGRASMRRSPAPCTTTARIRISPRRAASFEHPPAREAARGMPGGLLRLSRGSSPGDLLGILPGLDDEPSELTQLQVDQLGSQRELVEGRLRGHPTPLHENPDRLADQLAGVERVLQVPALEHPGGGDPEVDGE